MKLKYLAYCRKSSEEDSQQMQSIDTQKRLLFDFVRKEKLHLVDVLVEKRSAKDDGNRPVFDELLKRFLKGDANALLVAHIDRISRNEIEAGQIVKLLSKGIIKEVRTPSRVYNVLDLLYLNIEFAFAADYSRRLSMRVKEGMESKLKKGEYPRLAPLGYINRKGRIYPDPRKAPLIKNLFETFSTGEYSLKQITKYMFDQGFRTRAGNRVVKSVIHRLLRNPLYCGLIKINGVTYSGIHKPLVNKALYDRAQEILAGKGRIKRRRLSFLYRGYLLCGECGCRYTANLKKQKYSYYYCTNGKGTCGQHASYLNSTRIQELLADRFAGFSLPGDLAKASLNLYARDYQRQAKSQDYVSEALRKQVEGVDRRLARLEDMLLEERISPERYDVKRQALVVLKAEYKTQLKNLPSEDPETTLELLTYIKDQAVNLYDMFVNGDDKVRSDLLKAVLWNCDIRDGEIVTTRYKKPFAYMEGLSKETDLSVWWG